MSAPATAPTELPTPDSSEPVPGPGTNATRHLCAGAYLDDEFCLTALRQVYYQPKRIIAPSHGFDIIAVLGHCLRARRIIVMRDILLVALLVLASWLSVSTVVLLLLALLVFHVVAIAASVGRESIEYLRAPKPFSGPPGPEGRLAHAREWSRRHDAVGIPQFRRLWWENLIAAIVARALGITLVYLTLAALTVWVSLGVWHAGLFAGAASPVSAGGIFLGCFAVAGASRAWSRTQVRALRPGISPDCPTKSSRLSGISVQLNGNTVVYSGHRPFVGAGEVIRRWDLAQRLVPIVDDHSSVDGQPAAPAKEFPEPPFTARQISQFVRDDLLLIAADTVPERRLPDLEVTERIFVAGTEISDLQPDTPAEQVRAIIRTPTAPQRHYLVGQVVSWRGELVTTVYVHFAVQGKTLYVELHVTGLMPCARRFRVVDEVGGTGLRAVFGEAVTAMRRTPLLVASAPASLIRYVSDVVRLWIGGRIGRIRRGYDYGARVSVREIGASESTRDHMQIQDIVKYGRIIERRVLAATLDFLQSKGVDLAEFQQRALMILNAGAVATGGGTVIVSGDTIGNNIAEVTGPSPSTSAAGA